MADSPSTAGGAGVRPAAVLVAVGLSVALAGAAAAFLLLGRPVIAGVVMAAAGSSLVLAGLWVDRAGAPRLAFVDAVAERAVDVTVLGAIAWAVLPEDGFTATAALAALVTSYLASYLRAKATGLGIPLDEAVLVRPLRLGLISVALFAPENAGILLSLSTLVSVQSLVRLAAAVARREPR